MASIFTSALMVLLLLSNSATTTLQTPAWPCTAPEEPTYETMTVNMTGYNAVPGQTDSTPDISASGYKVNANVDAARSRDLADVLPFGTVIELVPGTATSTKSCELPSVADSIGYRVITDTMNPRIHEHIDILFHTDDDIFIGGRYLNVAKAMGWCDDVSIRIVGHIDLAHKPRTQAELRYALGLGQSLAVAQ